MLTARSGPVKIRACRATITAAKARLVVMMVNSQRLAARLPATPVGEAEHAALHEPAGLLPDGGALEPRLRRALAQRLGEEHDRLDDLHSRAGSGR
jgi:hypothetical protein